MHVVAMCALAVMLSAFAGMIDTPVGSTQIQNNLAPRLWPIVSLYGVNRFCKGF